MAEFATAGSLCTGYDGLEIGLARALGGINVIWHVENGAAPSRLLEHRFPGVPNYGDLTTVDWSRVVTPKWLTAGFPCQDLSHAGKQAGMRPGARSGLWFHVAYAIGQLRPPNVLIENVRGLLSGRADRDMESGEDDLGDRSGGSVRALGVVLGDLADHRRPRPQPQRATQGARQRCRAAAGRPRAPASRRRRPPGRGRMIGRWLGAAGHHETQCWRLSLLGIGITVALAAGLIVIGAAHG